MGLVYKNDKGEWVSISGTAYANPTAGVARLNIKTGSGATDVLKLGLTTNTSATQYCGLRMKVSGGTAYIGRSESARSTVNSSSSLTNQTVTTSSSSTSGSKTYTSQSTSSYQTNSVKTYATSSQKTYTTFSTSSYQTNSTKSYTTSSSQATNSTKSYSTYSTKSYTTSSTNTYSVTSAYGQNSTSSYGTSSTKTYQTTSNNSTSYGSWSSGALTLVSLRPNNMYATSSILASIRTGSREVHSAGSTMPSSGAISASLTGSNATYSYFQQPALYFTAVSRISSLTSSYTEQVSGTEKVTWPVNYNTTAESKSGSTVSTSTNRGVFKFNPGVTIVSQSTKATNIYWSQANTKTSCPGALNGTSGGTKSGTFAYGSSTSTGFLITRTTSSYQMYITAAYKNGLLSSSTSKSSNQRVSYNGALAASNSYTSKVSSFSGSANLSSNSGVANSTGVFGITKTVTYSSTSVTYSVFSSYISDTHAAYVSYYTRKDVNQSFTYGSSATSFTNSQRSKAADWSVVSGTFTYKVSTTRNSSTWYQWSGSASLWSYTLSTTATYQANVVATSQESSANSTYKTEKRTNTTGYRFAQYYQESLYNWSFTTSTTASRYTTLNSTVNYNTTSTSYWTVTSTHNRTSTVNYNTTSTSTWNTTSTSYWTHTSQWNTTSTSYWYTTSTSTWNTSSRSDYNTSSLQTYNTTSTSTWNTSSSSSSSTSGNQTLTGTSSHTYSYTKSYLTHNFNI